MLKALASLFLFVLIIGGIGVAIVATQQKTNSQSQASGFSNMTVRGVIIRTPRPPKPGWDYELTEATTVKLYVLPAGGIKISSYLNIPVQITGHMIIQPPNSYITAEKISRL